MSAENTALRDAVEKFLKDNDPEGFGCACQPDGHICGPCRWRTRVEPLVDALAAQAPAPAAAVDRQAPKDHEIAQAVNALRDVALKYHATQQLREQIAWIAVPLMKRAAVEPTPTAADRQALAQECKRLADEYATVYLMTNIDGDRGERAIARRELHAAIDKLVSANVAPKRSHRMRAPSELMPVHELRELVAYDPQAGTFTANKDRGRHKVGDSLGFFTNGYRYMRLRGKTYKANRVAWAVMTGEWPEHLIDHANGNPGDDRWENLRECSQSENMQNGKLLRSNTSGYTGVYFDKRRGKYQAFITKEGKQKFLGRFNTAEDGHRAHLAAKAQLHDFQPVPRDENRLPAPPSGEKA